MPEVTDPALLMALNGSGKGGASPYENKTQESQFVQNPQLREVVRSLANAQAYNMRLPTGRFHAAKNDFFQYAPNNPGDKTKPAAWTPNQISDYQGFLGLQQELTKPLKSLINPPGSTTSGREMDAVAEQQMAQSMIPGPGKEFRANVDMINRSGRRALNHIAFNAFMSRWRANHGGSVYAKSKNGETAEQAWNRYQTSPAYNQTVQTPFTTLLNNGGRAPKAGAKKVSGGPVSIKDDAGYDRLPSGAHFIAPDGSHRVKP